MEIPENFFYDSLPSWIQAVVSAIGIPFLVYNLVLLNRQLMLQQKDHVLSQRPLLQILNFETEGDVCFINIEVLNNDAVNIRIEGTVSEKYDLIDFGEFNVILFPRVNKNHVFSIKYKLKKEAVESQESINSEAEFMKEIIAYHGMSFTLTYTNDLEYKFSSKILGTALFGQFRIEHDPFL